MLEDYLPHRDDKNAYHLQTNGPKLQKPCTFAISVIGVANNATLISAMQMFTKRKLTAFWRSLFRTMVRINRPFPSRLRISTKPKYTAKAVYAVRLSCGIECSDDGSINREKLPSIVVNCPCDTICTSIRNYCPLLRTKKPKTHAHLQSNSKINIGMCILTNHDCITDTVTKVVAPRGTAT